MIPGLTQTDPTASVASGNKVYYEHVVLTVAGTSQHNDDIYFKELPTRVGEHYVYWSLPQNFVFVNGERPPNTTPQDGKLYAGDVCTFSLNLNPKRNAKKAGSFYANIASVSRPTGEPIAQQSAPPQGDPRDEWGSKETDSFIQAATGRSQDNYWDEKDKNIRKSQALNLLRATLNSGDTVNAPKMIAEIGFETTEDAITAFAFNWNRLRNGLPPFPDDEETNWENPAAELDQQANQHLSEQQPGFQTTPEFNVAQGAAQQPTGQEEDVEEIPW